ncbi:MAG: efflux RND transporter periplasmic adaptor subunit [Candidatus Dadabacteria bacterium]|nr:MAG: efflux RND transporter periplasmic adaptor subunit [Candidatus Dadabacteria bacterium]
MTNKVLSAILIFTIFIFSCGGDDQLQLPTPTVQVYVTTATDVPIFREFVGETLGETSVDIAARVQGFLETRDFKEGSFVKKGQLLYTIESQPFEEKVAQASSQVAASQVNLTNAQNDLSRIKPLAAENAISQIDLDAAQARYEAAIESVKASEANLRAAELQLSYTKVYSPINGVIGKTQANEGDYVGASANTVVLTTVSYIDTMAVQFYLTQTEYLEAARRIQADTEVGKEGEADEGPDDLVLILSDSSVYEYKGKFDFIDRNFDTETGSILVQTLFPNPNQLLRPGLFARVRAEIDVVKNGILVPQRCIMELQGKFSVFVVGEDNKVETRLVQTGPTVKEFWLIKEGLKPGEKVIYEGLQQVREGQVVNPEIVDIKIPDLESI